MTEWRNRIVGLEEHKPGEIADHPHQWRSHTAYQQSALWGVLEEVGIAGALLVYESDDGQLTAIDGHLRKGLDPDVAWPCLMLDVNDAEAAKLLATVDPLAALAGSDADALAGLLEQVATEDEAVQKLLDEVAAEAGVVLGDELPEDPGARVSEADRLQEVWGTELGQVWECGEHRLAVGDCTDEAVVERLMRGEKYGLLVTDPPYGVSYADKNKFLNAIAPGNRIQTPIEGDHRTAGEMSHFWRGAFTTIREFAKPGACYYVTGPQGGDLLLLLLALRDSDFPLRHMLIWAKNNHVLGRSDYNYKHEPIIYGWVGGAGHKFYGEAGETSLWEIPKPQQSKLHPTMKPVELFERAIRNSSRKGDTVLDPFAGSGTTAVACEKLGRRARMVEVSPAYCAVAIQRWADLTNGEPRLLGST